MASEAYPGQGQAYRRQSVWPYLEGGRRRCTSWQRFIVRVNAMHTASKLTAGLSPAYTHLSLSRSAFRMLPKIVTA